MNNKVKVTKTHQLLSCLGFKSCKFGYNPLETLDHSEENVHLKVFGLNLEVSFPMKDCLAQHSTNSGQKFGDSRNSNVVLNVDCLARH